MDTSAGEERNDSPRSLDRSQQQDCSITAISLQGDLLLRIEHEITGSISPTRFRVSSAALRKSSKYFSTLLQGHFGESTRVAREHKSLIARYGDISRAPVGELPRLDIRELGRISQVKSLDALCSDFLSILHGSDVHHTLPVANLANLAIVADRFDALDAVRLYVERKKLIRAIDGKTTSKLDSSLTEEKVRQRMLVAILLDYPPWVAKYSARLLTKGWVGRESADTNPLWWDLPARVEDELAFRRACVLETMQSLQYYFVGLYTSRDRQCRLGYDSSSQCDTFQLGEMIRFFARIGTLRLQGALVDTEEAPLPFDGDVYALLDNYRSVGEVQIDRHHTHCGIRTRIVPLLDLLALSLQSIGICGECWATDRAGHAWIHAKRPLLWKTSSFNLRSLGHREVHDSVQALFTAAQRDWGS